MNKQTTNTIMMIEPVAFGFNSQTACNNYFQQKDDVSEKIIQQQALSEFNLMVDQLREKQINLIIVKDTEDSYTPDSIFPTSWISFHDNMHIAVYPLYAENRRAERRADIIYKMSEDGFAIWDIHDYSVSERKNIFLEGTASMVLDHVNKIAYAALSERTDKGLFLQFCKEFLFYPICFSANQTVDGKRLPVHSTNLMMCVGDKYSVVCLDSIDDETERKMVTDFLTKSGKEIIEISEDQMHNFAGNMLQLENIEEDLFLIMSETAYNSLTDKQIKSLSTYNGIIKVSIPTIEKYGGGSVGCMMAEVFNPKK